jgi:hypothetical protein
LNNHNYFSLQGMRATAIFRLIGLPAAGATTEERSNSLWLSAMWGRQSCPIPLSYSFLGRRFFADRPFGKGTGGQARGQISLEAERRLCLCGSKDCFITRSIRLPIFWRSSSLVAAKAAEMH